MKKRLAVIGIIASVALLVAFQTHTFGALDTANTFTALQSFTPTTSQSTPAIAIGTGTNNSVNSQILIARTVDDTGGSGNNAHEFSDSSTVTRSGTIGYNSYDCRGQHSGTSNFDHYACWQNGWTFAGSGTITNVYGLIDIFAISSGTATNRYGAKVNEATGAGTITNNIGFDVASLTKGATLNYAFQSEGTTPSNFGGDVRARRLTCQNATAYANSDATPSSAWGTGRSTTAVGTDCGAVITVTTGTSPTANPTVGISWKDGQWSNASGTITPIVVAMRQDVNAPTAAIWTLAATINGCTFTFNGTPVAASTYSLEFVATGR